jgi:Spy/CpxP family protein refolding chaperone
MKKRNLIIGSLVTSGLIALAAVGAAGTRPGGHCDAGYLGVHTAFAGPLMHGHLQRLMRELSLTEEQRDKVFDIAYAQMPAAREKIKELRAGRTLLTEAAMSANYDPQQVRKLADAQAQAISDLVVMWTLPQDFTRCSPPSSKRRPPSGRNRGTDASERRDGSRST